MFTGKYYVSQKDLGLDLLMNSSVLSINVTNKEELRMPKVSDIKKNSAVEYNDKVFIIRDIERSVPQGRAGGCIFRMRMYDVVTGSKTDVSFKDSESLNFADLNRRPAMFSYVDGDDYVFMDDEDYTQYNLNKEAIAEEVLFINERVSFF